MRCPGNEVGAYQIFGFPDGLFKEAYLRRGECFGFVVPYFL